MTPGIRRVHRSPGRDGSSDYLAQGPAAQARDLRVHGPPAGNDLSRVEHHQSGCPHVVGDEDRVVAAEVQGPDELVVDIDSQHVLHRGHVERVVDLAGHRHHVAVVGPLTQSMNRDQAVDPIRRILGRRRRGLSARGRGVVRDVPLSRNRKETVREIANRNRHGERRAKEEAAVTGVQASANRADVERNRGNRVAGGTHPRRRGTLPTVPVVVLDGVDPAKALSDLRDGAVAMVRARSRTLVVDVSHLATLSPPLLTALLWTQRRCRARGGVVILRGLSGPSRRALQETGLWRSVEIEPDGPGTNLGGPQPGTPRRTAAQ